MKIILVPFLFFRVCCPLSVALIFVVFLPIRLFSFVISSVLRFHGLLGDRFFLVCFKSSKLQCFFCSKPDLHGFPMDLWVPDVSSCASGPDKRPSATTARHRTKQSFPTKTRQKSRFVKIYRPQIAWKVISHFRGFLLMQKKHFSTFINRNINIIRLKNRNKNTDEEFHGYTYFRQHLGRHPA